MDFLLIMVLDTVVYHPTLDKVIQYLDSSAGRDKLLRLLQYLTKFVSFYLIKNGHSIVTAQTVRRIEAIATLNRKALRFLKPLNHLKSASATFDNKLTDKVTRYSQVLRDLGYAVYLALDSVSWFKQLGISSTKRLPQVQKLASLFWFVAVVGGAVNDLRKIRLSQQKVASLKQELVVTSDKEGEQTVSKETINLIESESKLIGSTTITLIRDLLDGYIALNGFALQNKDEKVGLAGVISSLIGIRDVWQGKYINE